MPAQNMMFDHDFQHSLDQADRRREAAHNQALAAAAAEHDRVREAAEAAIKDAAEQEELDRKKQEQLAEIENLKRMQEKHRKELEQIRKLAEEEDRKAAERKAQLKRETEKAVQEAARRKAEAAAEAEEERREQEERDAAAEMLRKREADEEAKKLAAQEAAKKTQTAPTRPANPFAQGAGASQPAQAPRPVAAARPSTGPMTADPSREQTHERYLYIHRNMKELRKWMDEQKKTNVGLKNAMGDGRREIRKNVGQLTGDSKKNAEKREIIAKILMNGASFAEPKVNVGKFLYDAPPESPETKVPALLIYLINIFIKALMRQFVGEGGVKLSMANPIGIVGSAIFAKPELQWNGRPMIDMLVAKYHKACPVLFGIYGPENSDAGKKRIGWGKVFDGKQTSWIPAQDHADRMLGFGAGYAALTLRNYERSKLINPYPAWHFWVAASTVINTPASQIQPSHCYVLRALMAGNEQRLVDLFGDFALILLRHALIDFPKLADQKSPATQQLRVLADQMSQEKKMYLLG